MFHNHSFLEFRQEFMFYGLKLQSSTSESLFANQGSCVNRPISPIIVSPVSERWGLRQPSLKLESLIDVDAVLQGGDCGIFF